ncbi:MAG: hypothetical protein K9M84_11230 [Spirochaetia bacterium]|nr:hypothetical protein [Spirochaetia bacterium]
MNSPIVKTLIILLILLIPAAALTALDIGQTGWEFHLVDNNFFYPNYAADPFAPRFEASDRSLSINEIALDSDSRLDITAGTRFSLFSFRRSDDPDVGIQLDLFLTIPMYMEGSSNDFLGMDGIYSIGLVLSPSDWFTGRFSRHHICTHAGDEIDKHLQGSPSIDYDSSPTMLSSTYVRDDFGISLALNPLVPMGLSTRANSLLVYGDFYYFWPGEDPLGTRQIKPAREAYYWTNMGIEIRTPDLFGSIRAFAAYNVSAWQELSWMPSHSVDAGIEIPGAFDDLLLRVSYSYYNGRSLMNNFYNRREVFEGISISIDK